MLPDGSWFSTVRFGGCDTSNDVGKVFQLVIVTADDTAHEVFMGWLKKGSETNDWTGLLELPAGATEQLRIFVTRSK
jgi:hypothetical protein